MQLRSLAAALAAMALVMFVSCTSGEEGVADRSDSARGRGPSADVPSGQTARGHDGGSPDSGGGATDPGGDSPAAMAGGLPFDGCQEDADCALVNDCCHCLAQPKSIAAPACDRRDACLQGACLRYGALGSPRCVAGRCVLGLDCDTAGVVCKRAPPSCPAGQVPRATEADGARCYGECVEARQCLFVAGCEGCAADEACVEVDGRPRCTARP